MNLRPYQTEAAISLVAILQQHRIAYLRGEVRVGKTLTVLDALKRLGIKSCLFVTKKKPLPQLRQTAMQSAYLRQSRLPTMNRWQNGLTASMRC